MQTRTTIVTAAVCILLASGSARADWGQVGKMIPSDGSVGAQFARSVSASQGVAIVGARYDSGVGQMAGAAYVFELNGPGVWTEAAKLTPSDAAPSDWFGHSVSVDGSYAIVGAYGKDGYNPKGAAYVFERSASGWTEVGKLLASDRESQDQFGYSVSVSGDRAIVGTAYAGAAYVFERNALGGWDEAGILKASDLSGNQGLFGQSVAMSGDYAVVGAYGANGTPSGAAYVFERLGSGSWVQTAKLVASDAHEGQAFGWSVAVQDNHALIGAMWDNDNGNDSGAGYVFERDQSGVWVETAKMIASNGVSGDSFGVSVALDGEFALIGANRGSASPQDPTAAYVFEYVGGTWAEVAILLGRSDLRDYYGEAVSISKGYAFVGAYADDVAGPLSGAAYVYQVPEPVTLAIVSLAGLALVRRRRRLTTRCSLGK